MQQVLYKHVYICDPFKKNYGYQIKKNWPLLSVCQKFRPGAHCRCALELEGIQLEMLIFYLKFKNISLFFCYVSVSNQPTSNQSQQLGVNFINHNDNRPEPAAPPLVSGMLQFTAWWRISSRISYQQQHRSTESPNSNSYPPYLPLAPINDIQ